MLLLTHLKNRGDEEKMRKSLFVFLLFFLFSFTVAAAQMTDTFDVPRVASYEKEPTNVVAYGLDSSFTISDLFSYGFELENLDDGFIKVTPPKYRVRKSDKAIESFILYCFEGLSDDYFVALLNFVDSFSYSDAYSFISKNYGEGRSKTNTEFFIYHYSMVDEDAAALKLIMGDSKDFERFLASCFLLEIGIESLREINMWELDNLFIFTICSDDTSSAIFLKTEPIVRYVNSLLSMALSYQNL